MIIPDEFQSICINYKTKNHGESRKKSVKDQLKEEMVKWQTKIDEARLQLNLGALEAKDKLQPHINELEKELDGEKKQLEEFDDATEEAWEDIQKGLKSSFSTMKESFKSAKKHFK